MPQGTDLPHGASPRAGIFPSAVYFCYVMGKSRCFVGQNAASSAKLGNASIARPHRPLRSAARKKRYSCILGSISSDTGCCMYAGCHKARGNCLKRWQQGRATLGLKQIQGSASAWALCLQAREQSLVLRQRGMQRALHPLNCMLRTGIKKARLATGFFAFQVE
ncbi:hypothetical protein HS961_06445 [Comamonas piscis]|uniref:Uncharacterized protein n=1 Tax=Comamonas piscis TaxID=1562974 RepID=A0A7G5EES9_9BURK|nr:hypothetical protein [Comamonas piscis]QMV72504.1 hypothetical protein HS961_06445 [Comamonas piscis]WSO35275.1 hypothetical protein VUJ63_06470 [Comamonas piscis]